MKWTKLGKIFTPKDYNLLGKNAEFAQSPQAIVFDDFVRIYFSTREKDDTGKYLSHIAYIDIEKDFKTIKGVSSGNVIQLGDLGCFDQHGIFPINVYKDENKILAYTTGWNRKVSVSADASIGLAISNDNGKTFDKHGSGPVLTSSLHEPFLVADAFVTKFSEIYHMWYIFGVHWDNTSISGVPERVYKIGHAQSTDGISWEKSGKKLISDTFGENECQALPTVIYYKGKYHMYFCYRQAVDFRKDKKRGYRIGYAHSVNLTDWQRDDDNSGISFAQQGWDSDMQCYPFVFKCDDKIYMLYNGNEFGRDGFGIAVLKE